jgi:hypothetical protein
MMPLQKVNLADSDTLTVLTSAGPRLTKVWDSAVGKVQGYERALQVSVAEHVVCGIYELSALLVKLETAHKSCIIRGQFIGAEKAKAIMPQVLEADRKKGKNTPMPKDGYTLRRLDFFEDRPLHFFFIDIDKYKPVDVDPVLEPEKAIDQYIAKHLPECFHGVTYHWQLSSGAGHPDNAGVLKAHVVFWLKVPMLGDDLELWVHAKGLSIDPTVFRTVQPNYTAAPVFINDVADPVPRRSGLCEGWAGDEVDLVIEQGLLIHARSERKKRADMVDPREKTGLIGLFHRVYSIEEVVDRWLPEVFEFVTEWRLTYLKSDSGAAEGAGVTDNRQGIFNTHANEPFNGRAANKWDLVRVFRFGHLDDGLGKDEKFLMGIGDLPSQKAMLEMVRGLPEIVAAEKAEKVLSQNTHADAVKAALDEAGLREVAHRIALDGSVDRLGRELLAVGIQEKFKELCGKKPSIEAVRGLLGIGKRSVATVSSEAPDWLQGWCYVTSLGLFFNVNSKESIKKEAFDAAFCRFLPPGPDGDVPSAAKLACDVWQIPVVYNLMYLPSVGPFFDVDGKAFANTYRPESAPQAAQVAPSDPSLGVLYRHVELVIPDPAYRKLFLEWAAWIVTNPGKKVLWAVFIKGVEGDGKSVLGTMMAQAMGFENAGIISPETLSGSNFNDWAAGRCLNVIEELRMQGHNRFDAYNKLKPLITNPRIELHGKGKAALTAMNTCNYIAFSNHTDALPLDSHDRRQFVLFTPWQSIAEMHSRITDLGEAVDVYWDKLWDVVKNRPDVVRAFFEQIDTSGFNPHSRAPDTEFKDAVVALEVSDDDLAAQDVIASGVLGVGKEALSSSCLSSALALASPPITLHTSQVRKLLLKLGYSPVTRPVRWEGKTHRVWVKDASIANDNDQIRVKLDETKNTSALDFLS